MSTSSTEEDAPGNPHRGAGEACPSAVVSAPEALLSFENQPMGLGAVVFTLFLCFLWGGLSPAIKLSLTGMPPLAIAAWRFLIGLIALLIWCRVKEISLRLPRRFHPLLLGFGLVFVAQIGTLNIGTKYTTGSHSIVFLSTNPLWVALLAHCLIPNDRLHWRKSLGLMVAFAGVCVVFLDRGKTPGSEVLLGDALVLGSGVLLGVTQVYSKFLVRSINAFQVIVWELIYGTPLYFILSFIFERQLRVQLTSAVVAAVLYQGLVVAAFCFVTWTNLLRRYSASKMTAFHFTTPIFGVLLSRLILGENILPGLAAGVALVAIGIYVVSRPEGTNRQ